MTRHTLRATLAATAALSLLLLLFSAVGLAAEPGSSSATASPSGSGRVAPPWTSGGQVGTPTSTPRAPTSAAGAFPLVPPGGRLPSEAECAARVPHNPWEPVPSNAKANATKPAGGFPFGMTSWHTPTADGPNYRGRVTGNLTGTTYEIIELASCKWGFPLDIDLKQAWEESSWDVTTNGDGGDSHGLYQMRGSVWGGYPNSVNSTAFNADWALGLRRACYDGVSWASELKGNLEGCVGFHYSGDPAESTWRGYVDRVLAASPPTPPASSGSATPRPTPSATPSRSPSAGPTTAPTGGSGTRISSAGQLSAALKSAKPGDVLELADGSYSGNFVATGKGTSSKPIVLRGGRGAVIDGGSTSSGMALQLDGADYWRLEGFTVRGAQKALVLDRSSHNVLSGLDVGGCGMEAVHFRSSSSDNQLTGSDVHDTGHVNAGFGEGVYVGSAKTHWGQYGNSGGMDRSDRNIIADNRIFATTAENIDVKEGTVNGLIVGNQLDGGSVSGQHSADGVIDLKGNDWKVENNTGRNVGTGIQVHEQLPGWGKGNVMGANALGGGSSGGSSKTSSPASSSPARTTR